MVNPSTRKNTTRKNVTRKTGGPTTISELKKALGYSPRTRYATRHNAEGPHYQAEKYFGI